MRNTDTQKIVMKKIKVVLLMVAFISQLTVYASYAPDYEVEVKVVETPKVLDTSYGRVYTYDEIRKIAEPVAIKYGVDLNKMMYTMQAESHFSNVQSGCHKSEVSNCDSRGVREESYGVAQFHISTFPKEKALVPELAIDKMGYLFSKGEACRWTEYRKKYGCD